MQIGVRAINRCANSSAAAAAVNKRTMLARSPTARSEVKSEQKEGRKERKKEGREQSTDGRTDAGGVIDRFPLHSSPLQVVRSLVKTLEGLKKVRRVLWSLQCAESRARLGQMAQLPTHFRTSSSACPCHYVPSVFALFCVAPSVRLPRQASKLLALE